MALEALSKCPRVTLGLIVDGTQDVIDASDGRVRDYESLVEAYPSTPIDHEQLDFDPELPRLPTGKLYKRIPPRSVLG